jgi:NADH-quinone oxidoreductase subunit M
MNLPWLELAILTSVLGALAVSQLRHPTSAARWALIFTGGAFLFTIFAGCGFYFGMRPDGSTQTRVFDRVIFGLDELSAPLVPLVALLNFFTAMATARTKMRRFRFAWSLAAEGIRLATFSCTEPWVLIGLLAAGTVPSYLELVNRRRPARVYVLHMAVFIGLLVIGWASLQSALAAGQSANWAVVLILLAVLIRCGIVPAHCWLTDWFEHASFGHALLFVAPLTGVYAAVRLVLPVAPDWMLHGIGYVSLATAVYSAGMATVQLEARRFFAYLFLSHASLVLVGLELVTSTSLTGALALWFSITLSLGGFGLTLRALEARFGRLSLARFHGLYEHCPTLAVCFLITGLASVGFPGTLGFISADLLVDGAVEANLLVGVAVVAAAALNGIAVVRAYTLLFSGGRHASTVSLGITPRERFAVLALTALIVAGGLFPQPGIASRHQAALAILHERQNKSTNPDKPDAAHVPD